MNVLELKGRLLTIIAQMEEESVLNELYNVAKTHSLIEAEKAVTTPVTQPESSSTDLRLAHSPPREHISLEEIIKAQNYQPVSYEQWRQDADAIEWTESLDELLDAIK